MDRHKRSAKTIRLEDKDKEAIAAIREHYGLTSDNDAIRLALRETSRFISTSPKPQTRNGHSSPA